MTITAVVAADMAEAAVVAAVAEEEAEGNQSPQNPRTQPLWAISLKALCKAILSSYSKISE
jgi:hypothetical protein